MKIHFAILWICFFISGSATAQRFNLSGYIHDLSTGERLAGVSIINPKSGEGSVSNSYGYFNIRLDAGHNRVVFQSIGYASDTLSLNMQRDSTTLIKMLPHSALLGEVVVSSAQGRSADRNGLSNLVITPAEIKSLPRFGGETDVVKSLQLMPGIKAGRDGSSDLLVRGGGSDQNLILLDGVPIYNSAHSLGLFSVFNADAIKGVNLLKGSFPARYGGRLSSVLDIQLKDGNNDHLRYDFSAGLISSKLLLEGPLGSENTTFVIAARRTYLDVLAAIAQRKSEYRTNYNFFDANAKITHKISDKDRVFFSLYAGEDLFKMIESEKGDDYKYRNSLSWGTVTSALRYNRILSNKLFGNLTLTHTSYKFDVISSELEPDHQDEYSLEYYSKISDNGIKLDFDYFPSNKHLIKVGSSFTLHDFRPNVTSLKEISSATVYADTTYFQKNTRARDLFVYAEDDFRLSDKMQLNLGVHLGAFYVDGQTYSSLQPRLSAHWSTSSNSTLSASYARMNQNIHLLTATGLGGPADIWVPSTSRVVPQRSWQSSLGWSYQPGQLEFSMDAYYKEMLNILEYSQGASFLDDEPEAILIEESSQSWEDKVVQGSGEAYGVEFMLRKKSARTFGWVGYTLAWSNRTIPGVNKGETFPFTYDSRHSIVTVANHNISKRIRLSGSWQFNSGVPYSLPLSTFKFYSESPGSTDIEDLNVRNNFRMRHYHRLDMSISFIKQKTRGERSWNISVYNVYNRKNPYFVETRFNGSNASLVQVSLLPIIPSFSYSFSFR